LKGNDLSEIGLPTTDIKKKFNQLKSLTGIKIFDGEFERFWRLEMRMGFLFV
jgi:hypothetical protein